MAGVGGLERIGENLGAGRSEIRGSEDLRAGDLRGRRDLLVQLASKLVSEPVTTVAGIPILFNSAMNAWGTRQTRVSHLH